MAEAKRRILFYFDNYCGLKSRGGTEVATARIARALGATGRWEVFNAFKHPREGVDPDLYAGTIALPSLTPLFVKELSRFISDNRIDVVVNMGRFFRQKNLKKAILGSGRDVSLIFMHHFAPSSESKKGTYKAGWHLLRLHPANPLYWLRATVYPLLKLPRRAGLKKAYRSVYDMSDRLVLLSEKYFDDYRSIAGLTDTSKLTAIPNIFDPADVAVSSSREKRVLILSRMDEIQKRISLALRIWKRIEENPALDDWHLDIVGTGHDFGAIKRLAGSLGLRRATFHGWQAPLPFLQRASIIMLTSDYEGLPLSLLEAQTLGCVPIAFNSFGSVADVIADGENGVIVEGREDVNGFADRLSALMLDDAGRNSMSASGMMSASRFSSARIAALWNNLLEK